MVVLYTMREIDYLICFEEFDYIDTVDKFEIVVHFLHMCASFSEVPYDIVL